MILKVVLGSMWALERPYVLVPNILHCNIYMRMHLVHVSLSLSEGEASHGKSETQFA